MLKRHLYNLYGTWISISVVGTSSNQLLRYYFLLHRYESKIVIEQSSVTHVLMISEIQSLLGRRTDDGQTTDSEGYNI